MGFKILSLNIVFGAAKFLRGFRSKWIFGARITKSFLKSEHISNLIARASRSYLIHFIISHKIFMNTQRVAWRSTTPLQGASGIWTTVFLPSSSSTSTLTLAEVSLIIALNHIWQVLPSHKIFCCRMSFCWFFNRCHFLSCNKIFIRIFTHIILVLPHSDIKFESKNQFCKYVINYPKIR